MAYHAVRNLLFMGLLIFCQASSAFMKPTAPTPTTPAPTASAPQDVVRYKSIQFVLDRIGDSTSRAYVRSALELGIAQVRSPHPTLQRFLDALEGDRLGRTIRFYSVEAEARYQGLSGSGAPALISWVGPAGANEMTSPPILRRDFKLYVSPRLQFWYTVSSVWHELMHATMAITHHQTTPEGTRDDKYVDDAAWFTAIKNLMLDFPRFAADPVSGATEELYNIENNPWS